MNVKHSALRVHPKELNFPPPLNRVITNTLKLQNTSSEYSVAYKVKTTAPQRYCVRPNTGVLQPKEVIEVQVLLNYVKDAPLSLDCKDKFQIQSIVLKDPHADVREVWANAKEDDVVKLKLKARFAAPKSSTAENEEEEKNKAPTAGNSSDVPPPQFQFLPQQDETVGKDSPRVSMDVSSLPLPVPLLPVDVTSGITLDAHTSLRMALDQVVAANNEKEMALQQNTILNEKIKSLSNQVQLFKKEKETNNNTIGVRQRIMSNAPSSQQQQQQSTSSLYTTSDHQVRYDRLFLIVIVLLIVFFLGRWSK